MLFPKRLVFCGGGTRCLVFLQTLVDLESRTVLKNVNEYWGTSAGALLASLMAMNSSATRVMNLMYGTNFERFRDIDVANIFGITSTWGFDDGKSLTREIEGLFEKVEVGAKDKCLRDIPSLNIVVADLNLHETVVVNKLTFPNMRVVDAVRASMSLPIFFKPYVNPENGHYWVDGAIRAHFPWDMLPHDTARSEALGFAFEKTWTGGPRTFTEYLFSMIHFDEPKKVSALKSDWNMNIIWYPAPPYPAWYMKLQDSDFLLINKLGREGTDYIIKLWAAPSSSRPERPVLLPPSVRPDIPLSACLPDRTDVSSGTPKPSPTPSPAPSPPQLPTIQHVSRRWSV